jgi:hypothetical protein
VRAAPLALALLALVALLPTPPAGAQAGCNSLGVPPRVEVQDAQPGQSYQRSIGLQNPCDYGRTITVQLEGAAGAWGSTAPSSGFSLPPHTQQDVRLTLAVPAGAGPGLRQGQVRFVAEATDGPAGSGAHVRVGADVLLNITVGGEPVVKMAWVDARTNDTDTQTPPLGIATARNDGNVRSDATMAATVTALGANATLASATGTASADAGATFDVAVQFTTVLATGQYTMHFSSTSPAGFRKDVDFSVAPPGFHPPHGTLLALLHPAYAPTGDLVRIDGSFRNDGTVPIQSAVLKAEVRQGARLLATLQSDALAVPPGAQVNLTVYWPPPAAGAYALHGQVLYDGYLSHPNDSTLNVQGSPVLPGGFSLWMVWVLLALVAAAVAGWLLWRRRRGTPRKRKDRLPMGGPAWRRNR